MSVYLDRDSSITAIKNIKDLFTEITDLYGKYGIDFGNDVGRKNILISAAQEHFFAKAIESIVGECSNDGRTGMADIVIGSLEDREVECKVVCRGKTGSWSLQADKATLERKGSCDFLYLLFDRTHENVAVLLFEDLVPDDFYDPSPGSRGKARLKKSTAFKKCIPLVGSFDNLRHSWIDKYRNRQEAASTPQEAKIAEQKMTAWYNKPDSYSIQLESVDGL
tara:strand:- start:487 stop:1152 length:666 start_codon:yes stop_codon:yes gene_type:complete